MPPPELVFHDFREDSDSRRCLRAREALPLRRIETDLLLSDSGLSSPLPGLDTTRLFRFARAERFFLFVHLVDESAYTDRSIAALRHRLREEGALDRGTIIGSTHIAGLLRVKEAIPEVSNQGRFPVPGIDYVHRFGADLLDRLGVETRPIVDSVDAFEVLWNVRIEAARRPLYEPLRLIASYDAVDKKTGIERPVGEFASAVGRLNGVPCLDLLITNGPKCDTGLEALSRFAWR